MAGGSVGIGPGFDCLDFLDQAHPDYRQRRNPGIPLLPVEVEGALSRWASATLSKTDGCKSLEYLYLEAYRAIKRVDGIDLDHYIQNRGLAKYLRYLGFTSVKHKGVTVFNNIRRKRFAPPPKTTD